MRIAVVGLGGVGGYFGAKLAAKYASSPEYEVYFIARGHHLQAIQKNGLTVKGRDEEFGSRPTGATANPEEVGPVDFILFCVKGYDLENAAELMKPMVKEETIILPLLNGVDSAERLWAVLQKGVVLNGCCYIVAMVESPGVIRQVSGGCNIIFGPEKADSSAFNHIEELFHEAGIQADLVPNINVSVWSKYLFICSLGGVTSYYGEPTGVILEDSDKRELLVGLMREVFDVACAKGILLPSDIVSKTLGAIAAYPPDTTTSMQRDYARGSRTEIESLSGYIVRVGQQLGVPTPNHEKVYRHLANR